MRRRWWVYLLRCSDDSLYCGMTGNLDNRLMAHNLGRGAKYTRSRLPVSLAYSEPAKSKSAALRREAQIKRLPKRLKEELTRSK